MNSYVSFLFKPCFAMMYHYFITHCCRRDIIIEINHVQSQVSVNKSFMIWWNVQVQCGNLFQVESYNLLYTISPIQRNIALLFGVETHVCIMVLVWETCWVDMLHFTIFLVYKLSLPIYNRSCLSGCRLHHWWLIYRFSNLMSSPLS